MLIASFLREWRTAPTVDSEPGWVTIIKAILAVLDKGQVTAIVIILLGILATLFGNYPTWIGSLTDPTPTDSAAPSASEAPSAS